MPHNMYHKCLGNYCVIYNFKKLISIQNRFNKLMLHLASVEDVQIHMNGSNSTVFNSLLKYTFM